jgi:SAM-dependent methyltransferase
MSPPEWLGVLLAVRERGADLTGIDIIDPQRVRSRYPADLVDAVLSVPARVEDILNAEPVTGLYDTISCVSTLEHIGFDVASPPEDLMSAFVRAESPETATTTRDPNTDRLFLDAAHRLLEPGGHVLISVPAGSGLPILHQDSLGLFTHQFEYDEASWAVVTGDPRFSVQSEAYFSHDEGTGWRQVETFAQLTDQTSAMKPFATGCALVLLRHI